MSKWIVRETVQFTKIIEAETKEQAIEYFGNLDADTKQLKITATSMLVKHTKSHLDCNGKPYFANECPICDGIANNRIKRV